MPNNPAHRPAPRSGAARFGLESMESRTLLSGGGAHAAAPSFLLQVHIQQTLLHAGSRTQAPHRDSYETRGEGYSFQGFDAAVSPMYSPFVPPTRVVIFVPWAPDPRVEPAPPKNPPAPNENRPSAPKPAARTVVAEAPAPREEPRPATATPAKAAVDSAAATAPVAQTNRAAPQAAAAPASTTATVLEWVKSGAVYAADVAGLTPQAVINHAAPAAVSAVQHMAGTEQAVLSAAVNVIAAPAREFHIAKLGSPMALMQDAIGSFIEQSVSPGSEQPISGPRRAWYITLTVLTLDAALLTYYFQYRSRKPGTAEAPAPKPLLLAMNRFER
jgi:hypothetical protein